MNDGLIPSRYAKALYKFTLEKKVSKEIYEAALRLETSFSSEQGGKLKEVVSNPYVSDSVKREIIMTASGIDGKSTEASSALNDFITLLFKNNRISDLRGIVNAYVSLYLKENKISRVHVTWASTPESSGEERLKSMIKERIGNGTMEYSSSVNPSLIGGFKIAIDNEQLDASIENELRQLRHQLLSK